MYGFMNLPSNQEKRRGESCTRLSHILCNDNNAKRNFKFRINIVNNLHIVVQPKRRKFVRIMFVKTFDIPAVRMILSKQQPAEYFVLCIQNIKII